MAWERHQLWVIIHGIDSHVSNTGGSGMVRSAATVLSFRLNDYIFTHTVGDINEDLVKSTAQALVDKGLRDAGYVFMNL